MKIKYSLFKVKSKWYLIWIYMCMYLYIYVCVLVNIYIGRFTNKFVFKFIYFVLTYVYVSSKLLSSEALLMGYLMRLELTLVCSLNDFQLVMGLCRGHLLFFLECVYLSLLYPSLIGFCVCVCVCVCVCARVGVVLGFTNSYFSSVWVCVFGTFYVCVTV